MTKAENKTEMRALLPKEEIFCREYIIDFNQTKAAIRAGYSERSARQTAAKMMQKAHIQAEIKQLIEARKEWLAIDGDEIVDELTHTIRADIGDVMTWGMETKTVEYDHEVEPGVKVQIPVEVQMPFVRVKNAEDIPAHIRKNIAEISLSAQGTFKVKMQDKGAAMDKIMRHLGMFAEDNKQKIDPLTELIRNAQGSALPIASRIAESERQGAGDE